MSTYSIELVGPMSNMGGVRDLVVELGDEATLAEVAAAIRRGFPQQAAKLLKPDADTLAGHYTFNVNGRFRMGEDDTPLHPRDRIIIVSLAMGG
jgi:hypothetical protein